VDAQGDDVGIDKNAGADNAAHDDHGGVEYSEQLPGFDGIQESACYLSSPIRHVAANYGT
jgi:hypothetical protein